MDKFVDLTVQFNLKVPNVMNKYVITDSNSTSNDAYILGVPLKIISNPYVREGYFKEGYPDMTLHIKVVSLITGILYVIPFNSDLTIYDTFEELKEDLDPRWYWNGYTIYEDAGKIEQIVNKTYQPMCNSLSNDLCGNSTRVADHVCRILSVPFRVNTGFGTKKCILVEDKGTKTICTSQFMEWKLI